MNCIAYPGILAVLTLCSVGGELEGQTRHLEAAKRYCTPYGLRLVQQSTSAPYVGDGICEVIYWRGEPLKRREFTTIDGRFLLLDYSTDSRVRQYTLHWETGDDGSGPTMGWTVVGVDWP